MTMTPQAGQYVEESARKYHLERDLNDWWIQQAQIEVERTVPKAIEYGATDLIDIGHNMVVSGVKKAANSDIPEDEWEAELGIYFYMVGKMARWRDAIQRGERVSDDTLFDIGVYIRMVQRIRQCGGWPGVALKNFAPNPSVTATTSVSSGSAWTPSPIQKRACCDSYVNQYHTPNCVNWVPARIRDHHEDCILDTNHNGDCEIGDPNQLGVAPQENQKFLPHEQGDNDDPHQFD